jgi:hypothetical protein
VFINVGAFMGKIHNDFLGIVARISETYSISEFFVKVSYEDSAHRKSFRLEAVFCFSLSEINRVQGFLLECT